MNTPAADRTFVATVESWVAEQEEFLMAVTKQATQDVLELMRKPKGAGGNMPVDTSFLQNSLQGSSSATPLIEPGADGSAGPQKGNWTQVEALIAGWEAGTTLYFGFTANYAMHQNYGFQGRPGNFFVELSLQRWNEFVGIAQRRLAGELVFGG